MTDRKQRQYEKRQTKRPQQPLFGLFSLLKAAARKMFIPNAFNVAQNLTAFNPRTLNRFTPVTRS